MHADRYSCSCIISCFMSLFLLQFSKAFSYAAVRLLVTVSYFPKAKAPQRYNWTNSDSYMDTVLNKVNVYVQTF